MGWYIWHEERETGYDSMFGFYCNTEDRSFGPVSYISNATRADIYNAWEALRLDDPRVYERHGKLGEAVQALQAFLEGETKCVI